MTMVCIPLTNVDNSSLNSLIIKLEDHYIKPILHLQTDESVKYIEDNLTNFSADYIKIYKMILEKTDIQSISDATRQFGTIIKETIENSAIAQSTKEKLLDVIEIELENELYILDKLTILILADYEPLHILDENFKMVNIHIVYYLLAILYLLNNYTIENNDKIDKLTVLIADYIEEKDAMIETLDIILTPEKKEYIETYLSQYR